MRTLAAVVVCLVLGVAYALAVTVLRAIVVVLDGSAIS